jgi:hypothetical protein
VYLLLVLVSFLEAFKLHDNMVRGEAEAQAPKNRLARPQERVYIAALHWMTGDVVRDSWADGVVRLTETFGADNVFVSVYESGSWDDTKDGLRVLEAELEGRGVPHRIELSDETHQDELDRALAEGDYIEGPDGEKRVRRIPYMARIRNHVLDDLLALSDSGVHFDKVLFLGDVVFSVRTYMRTLWSWTKGYMDGDGCTCKQLG